MSRPSTSAPNSTHARSLAGRNTSTDTAFTRTSDTLLTSYLFVPDTEVPGIDTLHGRVDFLQLVGITQRELDWVAGESPDGAIERGLELARRIAADGNPRLITDLARTHGYLDQ